MEQIDMLAQKVGPRGGDLENPALHPQWRRAEFDGDTSKLHRFEKDHDSTANGWKNEQPWHRMAAYMLNAGRTNSEIAMAAGVEPNTVSLLRAQRWFQQLCATIANEEGGEILGLVRSEAAASVEKLVTLRDTAESERVQLAAATTLLEQAHGKPVQKNLNFTSRRPSLSPQEEYEQLQAELKALQNAEP